MKRRAPNKVVPLYLKFKPGFLYRLRNSPVRENVSPSRTTPQCQHVKSGKCSACSTFYNKSQGTIHNQWKPTSAERHLAAREVRERRAALRRQVRDA